MNKEIIIDGIDVSECGQSCYACDKEGQPTERIKCNREYKDRVYYCDEFENCNFKQLKRKEQENVKYKQALDEIEKEVIELFLGAENKDRPYCERILAIINKLKEQ